MKIYAIAIAAIVVLAPLAATAEDDRPKNCEGKVLEDGDKIGKNEAICIDGYRFGINSDRIFGLWDGDNLVKVYMKGADRLNVDEQKGGERAYLTLKDKNGKIIWQVKCPGLDGDSTTRLQIKDRKKNIVRFRQGDTNMWKVFHDGGMKKSYDCRYAEDKPEVNARTEIGNDKCRDGDWELKENSDGDCIKYWCENGQWKNKEIDDHYCDEDPEECDDPEWEVVKENGTCMKYWWCVGDEDNKKNKEIDDKWCDEDPEECDDPEWEVVKENGTCMKYWWCVGDEDNKKNKEVDDKWCDEDPEECDDPEWEVVKENGTCMKYWWCVGDEDNKKNKEIDDKWCDEDPEECDDPEWEVLKENGTCMKYWWCVGDEENKKNKEIDDHYCDDGGKDECKDGDWELKENSGGECIKYWCEDGKWKNKQIDTYWCDEK